MNCYIHVPFCRSKCAYCAFYSIPGADSELRTQYLKKLVSELDDCTEVFDTVYLGGGTPTLLEERELEQIFSRLRLKPGAEVTIEANPETLTPAKLAMLACYANRLSLGVQSFDEAKRRRLGRDCSDKAIQTALENPCFPNKNMDLMYAVPGDTPASFVRDLKKALSFAPSHLSCYSLTPEEQTLFAGTKIDEELSASLWRMVGEVLGENGICRYEVSNYARPGAECRHNRNVWYGGKLLGFGPAAASFDGRIRWKQPENLKAWLADAPPEKDELPPDARRREIFAVGLRTKDGWSRARFLALPGAQDFEWESFARTLARFPENLREIHSNRVRLTEDGLLFWDSFAQELL